MSYYRTCPHCGAHLDPGECCECFIEPREGNEERRDLFEKEENGSRSLAREAIIHQLRPTTG